MAPLGVTAVTAASTIVEIDVHLDSGPEHWTYLLRPRGEPVDLEQVLAERARLLRRVLTRVQIVTVPARDLADPAARELSMIRRHREGSRPGCSPGDRLVLAGGWDRLAALDGWARASGDRGGRSADTGLLLAWVDASGRLGPSIYRAELGKVLRLAGLDPRDLLHHARGHSLCRYGPSHPILGRPYVEVWPALGARPIVFHDGVRPDRCDRHYLPLTPEQVRDRTWVDPNALCAAVRKVTGRCCDHCPAVAAPPHGT